MAKSYTSVSFLEKLQQPTTREEAWAEFSERYGAIIFRWAMGYFDNVEDAKDVAQITAINLWKLFSDGWSYDKNGSFRAWLKIMTRNAAITEIRRRKNDPLTGGTANLKRLNEIEAANNLVNSLDAEHESEIVARATSIVKDVVNPEHLRVFELHMDGLPPREIASVVRMEYGNVTTILNRVRGKIKREAQRLNGEMLFEDGETDGKTDATESTTRAERGR